jgi:hypothetical protein
MAAGTLLSATNLSLLDVARRLNPDGSAAVIAEILSQNNEILDDIPFIEGNTETGMKTTVRSALPTATWRSLNQGVVRTKSTTNQIIENCGMLEAYSDIDKDLALMARDTNAFRFQEDKGHIEGMNQQMAEALFYGDTTLYPDRFVGIAPRYYSLATTVNVHGQIIDALGTTNLTSIYLVGWGSDSVYGIYPKNSQAGLIQQDLGEVTVLDASSNPYQGYRTHFQWKMGLCVRDYRFVVRIANIDTVALATAGDTSDTSANLIKYMCQAIDLIPAGTSKMVFYCSNSVRSMLRVKFLSKSNVHITLNELQGPGGIKRPGLQFMGIPVRRVDQISSAETRITT